MFFKNRKQRLEQKREERRQVFLKAARIIAERGWTHGRIEDTRGRVCILGALGTAIDGTPVGLVSYTTVSRFLDPKARSPIEGVSHIWKWNDRIDRKTGGERVRSVLFAMADGLDFWDAVKATEPRPASIPVCFPEPKEIVDEQELVHA